LKNAFDDSNMYVTDIFVVRAGVNVVDVFGLYFTSISQTRIYSFST